MIPHRLQFDLPTEAVKGGGVGQSVGLPNVGPSVPFYFYGVLRPVSDVNLHYCLCQPKVIDAVVYTALYILFQSKSNDIIETNI